MNLTFQSIIKHNKTKNKIKFTTSVTTFEENDYQVYEFVEPDNNVLNRIEISKLFVNIFAGPNSINLALNKRLQIDYETPQGTINLDSEMKNINITKELVQFEYNLYNGEIVIGNYKITLTIK